MDLNTILIILGVVALIALVIHGLWSNRRERSQYFENANTFTADARQPTANAAPVPPASTTLDNHVQTSSSELNVTEQYTAGRAVVSENEPSQSVLNFDREDIQHQSARQEPSPSVEQIKITLPEQPVYQMRTAPEVKNDEQKTVQDISRMTIDEAEFHADENAGINSSSEQLRVQLQEAAQMPTYSQSPLSPSPLQQPLESENVAVEHKEQERINDEVPNYLILYVVAAENRVFQGIRLTQALEELGFYLGKGNLYHRHLDLSTVSPVLFSAANITEPGTFDYYHLNDFTTVGITLFMQLPSEGNDRANLKMMIRAAKTLAEQLGGFVLNDQQDIFDEQSEQEYLARVN